MAKRDVRNESSPDSVDVEPGASSGPPSDGGDVPRSPARGTHGAGNVPEGDAPPDPQGLDGDGLKPEAPPMEADAVVDVPGGGGGGGGGGLFGAIKDAYDDATGVAEDAYDDVEDAAGNAYDDVEGAAGKAWDDAAAAADWGKVEETVDDVRHDPVGTSLAGGKGLETSARDGFAQFGDNLEAGNDRLEENREGGFDRALGNLGDAESATRGVVEDGLDVVDRAAAPLVDPAEEAVEEVVDPVAKALGLPDLNDPQTWEDLSDSLDHVGERVEPVYTPVEDIVNDLPGGLRDASEDFDTGVHGTRGVLGDVEDFVDEQVDTALDTPGVGLAAEVAVAGSFGPLGGAVETYLIADAAADFGRGAVDDATDALDDAGGAIGGSGGGGGDAGEAPRGHEDPLDHLGGARWDGASRAAHQSGGEGASEAGALLDAALDDPGPVHLPDPTDPVDNAFDVDQGDPSGLPDAVDAPADLDPADHGGPPDTPDDAFDLG